MDQTLNPHMVVVRRTFAQPPPDFRPLRELRHLGALGWRLLTVQWRVAIGGKYK